MWVLRRNGDGFYVTVPGSHHSYSPNLRKAQRFTSEAAAKQDKCGNETAATVESQLT